MGGIIVYSVVSPVHVRNAELLAREMPDWTFRVAYETWRLNARDVAKVPFEKVLLSEERVPDALWSGGVKALVFSTAQPRQAPIRLLRSALDRGVPTIAVEESNQIALNQGTVNNYLLPVDYVLTASPCERQGMVDAGFPERRFEVTGWPFYAGQVGRTTPDRARAAKGQLGLDPDRPVASLTLTGLNDAGESPAVRRRQLTLAAQGLPQEYQLAVKPHPIEKLDVLMPFVTECAPRARVIEGMVRADDLLEATDVLLNRGVSQVCIEALFREVPVVVLDTGVQTPFHGLVRDLVVERPDDLARALKRLSDERDPMRVYAPFREAHAPFSPLEARALTCRRIAEIAGGGGRDPDRARQWFDLAMYQAWWSSDRRGALEALSQGLTGDSGGRADAFRRLLQFQGTRDDLNTLRQYVGDGFQSQVLRCLWVDQLDRRREGPTDADLGWMEGFPPAMDTVWFLGHVRRWAHLLLRSGRSPEAKGFARRIHQDFVRPDVVYVPGIADVVRDVDLYLSGALGRVRFFAKCFMRNRARFLPGPIRRRLRPLVFY